MIEIVSSTYLEVIEFTLFDLHNITFEFYENDMSSLFIDNL